MDRYDLAEYAALVGLTVFAGIVWLPAALLIGSLLLLIESVVSRPPEQERPRAALGPRLAAAARGAARGLAGREAKERQAA